MILYVNSMCKATIQGYIFLVCLLGTFVIPPLHLPHFPVYYSRFSHISPSILFSETLSMLQNVDPGTSCTLTLDSYFSLPHSPYFFWSNRPHHFITRCTLAFSKRPFLVFLILGFLIPGFVSALSL